MKILTFDIEEWFHLLDFEPTRHPSSWDGFESRLEGNVDRLLEILEETNTRATFFVIGWVAKRYPSVVRRIAERYQIGCHTLNHQLIWQQTPELFRSELAECQDLLEDITGRKVDAFRAPGFSLREQEAWVVDALCERGFRYDSSVFPARHAHGGMPSYPGRGPMLLRHNDSVIKEFPISYKSLGGKHIVYSGGGYFRLCPYWLIRRWTRESDYVLSYIHPRDLDAGQPSLEGLPLKRRFKSYVGLGGAQAKLRRLLTDFSFTDIAGADAIFSWEEAGVHSL